ncbi:hypothetical protein E3P84_02411 [Wallemia ichthyophaga]|nr:hypothetical protein E3P84_02411 [Wallemia ichthyophaga]TIB41050.1 hypothetical protein E3P83_02364 [Wallemia ichthyophaga]
MSTGIIKSIHSDVDIPQCSLFDFLLPPSTDHLHKIAFVEATTGIKLTYAQLRAKSLELAYGLRKFLNIERKDTVLIISPNSIAYPVLLLGTSATGAKVSLANPAYNHLELSHQIKDSNVSLVFAHPDNIPLTKQILSEIGWSETKINQRLISATDSNSSGCLSYSQLFIPDRQFGIPEKFDGQSTHETAVMCYSSGTTGLSKGVMTTHYNIIANLRQLDSMRTYVIQKNDVLISVLPFYHIFGLVVTMFYYMTHEAKSVLLPRFDPDVFGAAVEKYKVSVGSIVPPILVLIANTDIDKRYNLSSLRILQVGAAPVGEELIQKLSTKFNDVITVPQGYGLTETSPITHKIPLEYAKSHSGYIGRLIPNTSARIVDENGMDVPGDNKASGELWVKGPQVMKGYLNRPEATAECMTADDFFKTGDVAIFDKKTQLFKIVDRLKELIKYKGFQVPPAALESLLLSNPEVKDVAVIGVYDDKQATELPRAYVVPQKDSNVNNHKWCKEVEDWMASKVANHSKLRGGVKTIDAIPKSPSGKILRRHLRTLAAQQDKAPAKL